MFKWIDKEENAIFCSNVFLNYTYDIQLIFQTKMTDLCGTDKTNLKPGHQFEHMFWVLKRTVSLRRFF